MNANKNKLNKKYQVIYADPPWSYQAIQQASKHYPTMSLEELKQIYVPKEDKSIIFMWATYPNLPEALELLKAWGFQYKTVAFVWIKTTKNNKLFYGNGFYTRANSEIVLLGVTPTFECKDFIQDHSIHQIVVSPVREHSRKPDIIRDNIVKLVGEDKSRIELFSREIKSGWDSEGNEKTKFNNDSRRRLF